MFFSSAIFFWKEKSKTLVYQRPVTSILEHGRLLSPLPPCVQTPLPASSPPGEGVSGVVQGVVPMPQAKDSDVMGKILETLGAQHSATVQMFSTVMSSMGKLIGEPKPQASGAKKRKKCPSPPPSEPEEQAEDEDNFEDDAFGIHPFQFDHRYINFRKKILNPERKRGLKVLPWWITSPRENLTSPMSASWKCG